MKKLILFTSSVILSILLISCKKDNNKETINNTCNVSKPAEDIEWLKKEIENFDEYSYIKMSTYKGESVFSNGNCNPAANYVSILRNCNGDTLGNLNDFENELTDGIVLSKHPNSKCNF
jgi:hypothetical protein